MRIKNKKGTTMNAKLGDLKCWERSAPGITNSATETL